MAREDVEIPKAPPAKRRQLELALDLWLATWLADPSLTPSEHRRVAEEKARRKALKPDLPVGVLVGAEGMTPAQRIGVVEAIPNNATALNLTNNAPSILARLAPAKLYDEPRQLIVASKLVIVAPRNMQASNPLQEWIRYARHRSLPVIVVLPDGSRA